MERRLAAIFAADVVGYSRLMGEDETGTLERLTALHKALVQPSISAHKGRIVKLMGDGLLAEFPSAVEAVKCAVTIQEAVIGHKKDLPDEQRIRLRIGINLGDVIAEGSDIYGDGVNVAARLEGITDPDTICISGNAYDMIEGKLDFAFEDIGEQRVKNIAKPVQAFKFVPDGANSKPSKNLNPDQAPSSKPSIAVLPFANMSADSEQEYFSDGITEDLITELSRFRELAVTSRNSSFVFKGQKIPLREIGDKLNAQYLVEGSIQKSGDRVRVTAQLIDAQSDVHIWAERYERAMEDIFAVQDDLVHRVASTLVGRLEAERLTKIKSRSGDQLKAYDLFLRGREHFFSWSYEDNCKARDYLHAVIGIEPGNAAVLALLSEILLRM